MRRQLLILGAVLLLSGAACSLSSQAPPSVESLPTATRPQSAFINAVSPTSEPTATTPSQAAAQSVIQQPVVIYYIPPNCYPRRDWWSIYSVQRGDTLSRIAFWSGVSVQTLAVGNCISDPNRIYAGQVLRIPRDFDHHRPPPPPPPPPPGIQSIGAVQPSPFVSVNNGQYQLQGGTVVSLIWAINASGLARVDFFLAATGTGMSPVKLGSDTYFGDGTSIAWSVPPGISANLSAIGYDSHNHAVKQTAQYTLVYTNTPPTVPPPPVVNGSALTFSPYESVNNNTFMLPPDQLITIRWDASFPSLTDRVVFELIPPGGGTPLAMGLDTNLGDGASILWRAVSETQGTVRAVAYFSGGYPPQYSSSYYVIARVNPPDLDPLSAPAPLTLNSVQAASVDPSPIPPDSDLAALQDATPIPFQDGSP